MTKVDGRGTSQNRHRLIISLAPQQKATEIMMRVEMFVI
jgi:hypothetical protein